MMTMPTMDGENSALATKCLDLCQSLTSKGKTFTFSLNIGPSFSFSLDTRDSSTSQEVVKKKLSPSAIRRNFRRKEAFLKKKAETGKNNGTQLEVEIPVQVTYYKCDQCEQTFKTENGMKIHVGKTHKDTIPQLDGNIEKIATDEVVQTLDVEKNKVILTPPVDPCPLCKDSKDVPDLGTCGIVHAHGDGWGGANCVTCHLVFKIKGNHGCIAICDKYIKKVCERCRTHFK